MYRQTLSHGIAKVLAGALLLAGAGPVAAADGIRIGSRNGVFELELEVDQGNDNLLAVLRYDTATTDCWSVNLSTDSGDSWTETYEYCTAQELGDEIGATIAGGRLYVAYIAKMAVASARLMRFRTSDGEQDPIYGGQTVFNAAKYDGICNVAVASNVDEFDDRLYYFAINEDALRFFWTDEDGGTGSESWHEIATGVTTAMCYYLAPTFNEHYHLGSDYNPMVAYQDSWDLYLWRYHGSTGPESNLLEPSEPVFEYPGAISAFDDTVAAIYWSYGYDLKACISEDAGDSFTCEEIGTADGPFHGDITARNGTGIAAVYNGNATGDFCEYRYLDSGGTWSPAYQCGGPENYAGSPIMIEPVSPYTMYSYGLLMVSNQEVTGGAYFVPAPVVYTDGFESGDTSAWSSEVQ
jgi:hypothetical protein